MIASLASVVAVGPPGLAPSPAPEAAAAVAAVAAAVYEWTEM